MLWHILLSEQREQLGRQLLCCLGRQLMAIFAKGRDRRQWRGKSGRQHKRADYPEADHCYAPDVQPALSECLSVAFVWQTKTKTQLTTAVQWVILSRNTTAQTAIRPIATFENRMPVNSCNSPARLSGVLAPP